MNEKMSLNSLPNEVVIVIISFIGYKDVPALSVTCKRLHRLCQLQLRSRTVLVNARLPDSLEYVRRVTRTGLTKNVTVNLNGIALLNVLRTKLPNVRFLVLKKIKILNNKNVHLIGDYLHQLRSLWLFSIEEVSDIGLSTLFTKCHQLQTLGLHYLNINGKCFKDVPILSHFSLAVCSEYTEDVLRNLTILFDRLGNNLQRFSYEPEF